MKHIKHTQKQREQCYELHIPITLLRKSSVHGQSCFICMLAATTTPPLHHFEANTRHYSSLNISVFISKNPFLCYTTQQCLTILITHTFSLKLTLYLNYPNFARSIFSCFVLNQDSSKDYVLHLLATSLASFILELSPLFFPMILIS